MPDGGELSITASKAQDTISLSLTYTGVGIPEAVRQKKIVTSITTKKSKRHGLGSAVVKRLVEALNGTITLQSQEGKRKKFTVEIPANLCA
jgi:hypothetical protein